MARVGRLPAALGLPLLTVLLVSCCPVASPPPTAFVATLTPLAGGSARAQLADGRQLTVVGLSRVPSGPVYVTGTLLPDGRVRVDSVQATPAAPPPAQPDR